jgi:hypothetical protein
MMLDTLPGDSLYKTAVRDAYTVFELAEMVKQQRGNRDFRGFGRLSGDSLLLAAIYDRLGVIASGRQYEKVPDPYPVPGVVPRGMHDPRAVAQLRAIAQRHADAHGYSIDDLARPI